MYFNILHLDRCKDDKMFNSPSSGFQALGEVIHAHKYQLDH